MASTNKTQNYELSQYIGSDKPTYLGDYNADMLKIDTQMKRNADNVASVGATATTASETANTAIENASSAQTSADEAQTSANSANNTATTALQKANTNETKITNLENLFNLNDIIQYQSGNMTFQNCSLIAGTLSVATNNNGSIGKIYGNLVIQNDGINQVKHILISGTHLRPDTTIVLNPVGIFASSPSLAESITVSIDRNGNLDITVFGSSTGTGNVIILPCIYFMKDFGDTPNN